MEDRGKRTDVCSPTAPPASLSVPLPLPMESPAETISGAAPPPPSPSPSKAESGKTVYVSPNKGGSLEMIVQLSSHGVQPVEASGTCDHGASEEWSAASLPLLPDEGEACKATFEAPRCEGASLDASAAPVLTDDLRDRIIRQVEYYFSDENLPTDNFLLKFVKKNKQGYVPVAVIASFRRMRKLVQDETLIVAALRTSSQLVVSSDGKKVKRLNALPGIEIDDAKPCTILVENLPENLSLDGIKKIFGAIGKIRNISIHVPRCKERTGIDSKVEKIISGKVHALVEYETIEEAENAVVTLNDEKNWRSGMRVELLLKRMEKFGFISRRCIGALEKSLGVNASEAVVDENHGGLLGNHDAVADQEEGKLLPGGKTGQKVRSRHRRQSNQQQTGGIGHGSSIEGPSKPPPGPRMPDGTRGFTMGRGSPCIPHASSC